MNTHPFLNEDFLIHWSELTPDKVKPDISAALEQAQSRIDALCELTPDRLTYDSTFAALENASSSLEKAWGRLMHLDSVCDNEEQRAVITEMMPAVVSFSSSIALNPRLWAILKQAAEAIPAESLTPTQKRHIEETLRDFRESGADLAPEQKQRVAEINNELSQLTKTFSENVLDSTNAWELIVEDESELAGLPASAKDAALESARAKNPDATGKPVWRFTQQYPSMGPVMQFADSDDLRKKVWEGACSVGYGKYDTEKLIDSILTLRDEKAALLGFATHADATTSRRMAGSGENALKFIEDLHALVKAPFLQDMEELRAYKEKKTGSPVQTLSPWEVAYWSELRRKELYDFDEEELRPYMSVQEVMKGMFDIVSALYGITVREIKTAWRELGSETPLPADAVEVWHPDVRFFEIYDDDTSEHIGSFYADWHPRESKRGGAWMNQLEVGIPPRDGAPRLPHLGLMCGNMTKPLGDKPALLTHREVETVFHEFGHLLHLMLSDVEVRALAGTNVAWDFVELPSQIMENWCWDRQAVDMFARHYETGEPIPEELFAKMRKARNYQSALAFMRQLTFGKLDLELHVHTHRYLGRPIEEVDEEILKDYRVEMSAKGPSIARRLTHLFADPVGYSAGYYSYKWAEVLDADAFTRFQKEGILNPATGRAFREHILSKGNSKSAAELYRNFMGRDPEQTALLKRSGIIE